MAVKKRDRVKERDQHFQKLVETFIMFPNWVTYDKIVGILTHIQRKILEDVFVNLLIRLRDEVNRPDNSKLT